MPTIACLAFVAPFKDFKEFVRASIQCLLHRSKPLENGLKEQYRYAKIAQILEAFDDEELWDNSNQIYDDVFSGEDFLAMFERLNLTVDDIMFSVYGAQLYQQVGLRCLGSASTTTPITLFLPVLIIPCLMFRGHYHAVHLLVRGHNNNHPDSDFRELLDP